MAFAWVNAAGIMKASVRGAVPPPPPSLPGPPTPPVQSVAVPSPALTAGAAQWLAGRGFLDGFAQALAAVLPRLWARAWTDGQAQAAQMIAETRASPGGGKKRKKQGKKKRRRRPQPVPPAPPPVPPVPAVPPAQLLAGLLASSASFAAWMTSQMLAAEVALIVGSLTARVAQILATAAVQEWRVQRLADALENAFMARWRAEMIAATEAARASNTSIMAAYRAAGIKWVRWVTRHDGRVCKICRANEAAGTIRLGKKFPSGNEMPPNHPRCRCYLRPSNRLMRIIGKSAGPLPGEHAIPASAVTERMGHQFPAHALAWIPGMPWVQADVPLSMIDYRDAESWNASHQPGRVAEIEKELKDGIISEHVVMVGEPSASKLIVIDGHHHALACRNLGLPVPQAYVGRAASGNGPWLETHSSQFPAGPGDPWGYAKGDKGPRAAGIAVHAADTGRVLMLQRALHDGKRASGRWELPGGRLDEGEDAWDAAVREWCEETGLLLPAGEVTGEWDTDDGKYRGFVFTVASESDLDILGPRDRVPDPDHPGGEREPLAWFDLDMLDDNPAVREELTGSFEDMEEAVGKAVVPRAVVLTMVEDLGKGLTFDEAVQAAVALLPKSADTPRLASTPHQLGPHGLWHTPSKKVPYKQKLPDYIENIAAALIRAGHGEQEAIAMAVAAVKRWAHGDLQWGPHRKVTPEVAAASRDAVRQWEELRATHG